MTANKKIESLIWRDNKERKQKFILILIHVILGKTSIFSILKGRLYLVPILKLFVDKNIF
jgi:hypothetical protein